MNPSKRKMPVASCGSQLKNWLHPYDLAPRGKIGNRVLYRPPYMKNPNFFPVGDGFGFFSLHWKCFLLTPAPSLPERGCRRFYFVGRNEWIFESLCQAAIGRTGLLCRLFSVAEHRHPRFAAYGAGVQHEVIAAVLDGVDLRRRQGFDFFNGVGIDNAFHIRKDDGITP